jgi:glycosyltransferase involved in cell wall biosynthesis
VATRVGGIPEVVTDDVTGLLVSPSDPASLAQACIRLLQDVRLQDRLGSQGHRQVLQHFQVETAARRTEALYEALLREKLHMGYVESKGWIPIGTS